jgi:hypothetical protein
MHAGKVKSKEKAGNHLKSRFETILNLARLNLSDSGLYQFFLKHPADEIYLMDLQWMLKLQ